MRRWLELWAFILLALVASLPTILGIALAWLGRSIEKWCDGWLDWCVEFSQPWWNRLHNEFPPGDSRLADVVFGRL